MSSDAMRSWMKLTYNGSDKVHAITDDCEGWLYTDNASDEADTIDLTLNDSTGRWHKGYYPKQSDYLKAWICTQNWPIAGSNELFCGRFNVDQMSYSGYPMTADLQGIVLPTKTNFSVTQKNKTWKRTSVHDILSDIAKNAGLTLVYHASNVSVKETTQSATSDMNFAFSLCQEYGYAMKLYNDKIVVYDQTRYEKHKAKYTINIADLGGADAYSFSVNVHEQYNGVEAVYTDDGHKKVAYKYSLKGTKGTRKLLISVQSDSTAEAEKKAKAALRESLREGCKVSLNVMGSPKYKSAQCFNLSGFGRMDGKYFMERVVHSKEGGAYRCSLEAHRTVTSF